MKRILVGTIALAIAIVPVDLSAASAQTLTLRIQESCQPPRGSDSPGFMAQASALPPNATFTGGIDYTESVSGLRYVATLPFTASPQGTVEITDQIYFNVPIERLTVFVISNGQRVEQTLHRLCQDPYSKDDCVNGGWRTYGVFKNQGDCVSFVVHEAIKACVFEREAIGRRAFREKYGEGRFDPFSMLRCIHRRVDG
jgi:hypothetical protein